MSHETSVRLNGAMVRHLRHRLQLTQRELATLLGGYQPYVSALERGVYVHVYPQTLSRLAQALGVAMEELVGEEVPHAGGRVQRGAR